MSDLTLPERQQALLTRIQTEGRIVAAAAARELGVSEDTIRRDLRDLAQAGLVRRYHGGALRRPVAEIDFTRRTTQNEPEKQALAARGLAVIRPGMTVLVDQSTTLLALVRALPRDSELTLVTPAPDIALAALDRNVREVVMIGGRLDGRLRAASGAGAQAALAGLHCDLCLLGVCAIDAGAGLTAFDHDDAVLKRTMIEGSAGVVALATGDKLGTRSPHRVAPLDALDRLVCCAGPDDPTLAACRAAGVEVDLVAP